MSVDFHKVVFKLHGELLDLLWRRYASDGHMALGEPLSGREGDVMMGCENDLTIEKDRL